MNITLPSLQGHTFSFSFMGVLYALISSCYLPGYTQVLHPLEIKYMDLLTEPGHLECEAIWVCKAIYQQREHY